MATDLEIIEVEATPITVQGSALGELVRAEIDQQISTAKHYPRDIRRACDEMMTFATLDPDIAAGMFYVLPPRGDEKKKIQGPSVRLAEVAGSCWGNLRYGARIIDVGEKTVTAQGTCIDLEKNIQSSIEVKRSITDKYGRRFKEHMVVTTCQAACSIALREAIFKVIPRAYINRVYERARKVSVGESKTVAERRNEAIEWYVKSGATKEQVLAFCGKERVDQLTDEDLIELKGLTTSIRDGDISIDAALRTEDAPEATKARPSKLNETVGKPKAAKPAPEPPKAPQPVSMDEFKRERRTRYEMAAADQNDLARLYEADKAAGLTPEQLAFVTTLYDSNKGGTDYV